MSKHFAPAIIALLRERPSWPLTSLEIAKKLGKTRLQITCAMVRLQRAGLVRPQGTKHLHGGQANYWIAVEGAERPKPRMPAKYRPRNALCEADATPPLACDFAGLLRAFGGGAERESRT